MKVQLPDGTLVEAKQLIEPIGQFTHWYLDHNGEPRYLVIRTANEQAYMFNEDVNKALTAALASGRYLVAVFCIDAAGNGADRVCHLHRVSHNFPYDAFEFCKNELAKNLDEEYKAPTKLPVADFVAAGMPKDAVPVDEKGSVLTMQEISADQAPDMRQVAPTHVVPMPPQKVGPQADGAMTVEPVGQPRPLGQVPNLNQVTEAKNDALVNQLQQMNQQAEADGIVTQKEDKPADAPQANMVNDIDEPVLVAHDPLAAEVASSEQAGG